MSENKSVIFPISNLKKKSKSALAVIVQYANQYLLFFCQKMSRLGIKELAQPGIEIPLQYYMYGRLFRLPVIEKDNNSSKKT